MAFQFVVKFLKILDMFMNWCFWFALVRVKDL